MKQAGTSKRSRSRSSERSKMNHRNFNPEHQASEGKIRGNPQQVVEKYLLLARDAASAGDRIAAEGYYQHADHYHRLVLATRQVRPLKPRVESEPIASEPSSLSGTVVVAPSSEAPSLEASEATTVA